MHQPAKTLDQLAVGLSATVLSVAGEKNLARRLMEMGLTLGTRLEVVRHAPFGDPIEVFVRGYYLTLRRAEAGQICVQV
jgi:ferrous iron transport protein A